MRTRLTVTSAIAGALLLGAVTAVSASPAAATATTIRYASPTGAGTECTSVAPCSLITAINSAPAHAVVMVAAGFYFRAGYPTTVTLDASSVPLTIEGTGGAGSTAPIIFSAASPAFTIGSGSVVRNIWLTSSTSAGDAVHDDGGVLDHSTIRASAATACDLEDSAVVLDSVCWSNGAGDNAIHSQFSNGGTMTLRGVTAVESSGGFGLQLTASNGSSHGAITMTNSIVNGGAVGDVDLAAGADQTVTVTLSHCDLAKTVQEASAGTINLSSTSTVKARPTYADPGVYRFEEAPGSPTINAGAPDPDTDHTDLDGLPRTIGKAPDIGAYEITQRPTVSRLRVARSGISDSRAKASVIVSAGGMATTIRYRLSRKRHKTVVAKQNGGQSGLPATFGKALRHLAPHTTYTLIVVARNVDGSASSRKARFTTKRRPHHKR